MAILGKDLFNQSDDFFEFTASFSNSGVLIHDKQYKCGEILTEFLDYEPTKFLEAMRKLQEQYDLIHFHQPDTFEAYLGECIKLQNIANGINRMIYEMPLYRHFEIDKEYLEKIFICDTDHLKSEYENPQAKFLASDLHPIMRPIQKYFTLGNDIEMIHGHYKSMIEKNLNTEGHNQYGKILIKFNDINNSLQNKSLIYNFFADKTKPEISYEVWFSDITGEPEIFEKMKFTTLGDFVFVELFKSLMRGNCPKRCKNCNRFFLLEKGFHYEYCDNPAPGEEGKTCRDVGSLKSFRDKVNNNDIWKIYQRAYKKYYARVSKGKMDKSMFNTWAENAIRIRDDALWESEKAGNDFDLESYEKKLNFVE